jgi:hypothetical protein
MIKKYCFLLLSLLWLTSLCSLPFNALADDFTISRGDHYSTPRKFGLVWNDSIRFQALFDESAEYDLNDGDQKDTNKLFGSSDCSSVHTENSARFGWRWNDGKVQIMALVHRGGKIIIQPVGFAEVGVPDHYEIKLSDDHWSYLFTFRGNTVTLPRGCSSSEMRGYHLYPYFGGNKSAPHEIRIKIEEGTGFANFSVDQLYPNPVLHGFTYVDLKLGEPLTIGYRIYDLNGKMVQSIQPTRYSNTQFTSGIRLDFEQLTPGLYFLQPFAIIDGVEKKGFVRTPGHAVKMLVK